MQVAMLRKQMDFKVWGRVGTKEGAPLVLIVPACVVVCWLCRFACAEGLWGLQGRVLSVRSAGLASLRNLLLRGLAAAAAVAAVGVPVTVAVASVAVAVAAAVAAAVVVVVVAGCVLWVVGC